MKAPENTLAALKLAVEERADGVEFDVYRTADGKLVLLHDADVLRTTDFRRVFGREKNPRVESLTLAELQRLDVGTWKDAKFAGETMPTLRQALEVLKGRSTPVVEIKPKTIGGDVARAIREAGLEDEVFVQSFSSQAIREFRQVLPSVATGFLTSKRESPDAVVRARAHLREARIAGANAVVCDHKLVVAEYVAELHRHAMSLWVYTVDEPTTMEMLIRIGVDGIITNVPDVLRELLARPGRTIEPGGAKTGQRIDLLRGQVPIAVLLRGLADFTGLAVVHDAKDRAIATAEVLVAADVRSADAQIIEAHLNAAGIRLTRRRLASGRLVIEASSSSRVAGASEPRPRPIFVVESDRSRRVRASRSGSVSGAGRSSRVRRVAGVVFADIPETVAAQVEIDGGAGVFVRSVDDEVRGGLRVLRRFDIVTRLGGRVVRSPAEVVADLERYRGGDDLTIRLLRKGELKILRVKR